MVLILDDRADVWGKGGPNLLKIFPFEFFLPEKEVNDLSLLAKVWGGEGRGRGSNFAFFFFREF